MTAIREEATVDPATAMAKAREHGPTSRMTMIQALRSAMDVMLERNDDVVVFGQDVGYFGGVFRVTEGLQTKYGKSRVFDAPISESGIVGAAVGMGAYGLRPVCEIQFADYFYPASDQIVSEGARLRYRSAGQFTAPMTIRMPSRSLSSRRSEMPSIVFSRTRSAMRSSRFFLLT